MGCNGLLAALLGATACTSVNPAFEATGEEGQEEQEGETTQGVPPATTSSSSTGAVDDRGSESGATTRSGDEETSTGEPPPMEALCMADLYGINSAGELHLIDVDTGTTVPLPPRRELGSWAVATDPNGTIYVNQYAQPNTVLVLEPVTFQLQDMLLIPGRMLPEVARAGVDPDGMVWVGTHDTNQFFRISPLDGTSVEHMPLGIGAGGDMMFLDSGLALIPSNQGNLSLVDFSFRDPVVSDVPVAGLMGGTLLTGIARDTAGRLWLGRLDGQLLRLGFMGPEPDGAFVDGMLELGVALNDLATMVVPPDC